MSWYKDIVSSVSGKISEAGQTIKSDASKAAAQISSLVDPTLKRLQKAGLLKGGKRKKPSEVKRANINFSNRISKTIEDDWRVRISMSPKVAGIFYDNDDEENIMAPLSLTSGVIFPYTPQIQVTYQANYTPQRLTHTNYQTFFYEASEVQAISITADFTVQNIDEAKYVLACIYFFRSATKMFYGKSQNAGNPPPIVFLNGYGSHYFPNVPCIVTQFTHTMPSDVDYIETDAKYAVEKTDSYKAMTSTRIPTVSQITVSLQPVYSKELIANNFTLEDFANGKLLGGKGSFL